MRVFRFLQARPYWLYKVAAGLVVIAVILLLVNIVTGNSETIFYPIVVSSVWVSMYLFGATLVALIVEILVNFSRPQRNSLLKQLGFVVLIVGLSIASLAVLGPSVNPIGHVASIGYGEHVYNLARGNGIIDLIAVHEHFLYECDRFGVICHKLDKVELVTQTYLPPAQGHYTQIELLTNSASNTVSILVDGEVVYTYRL